MLLKDLWQAHAMVGDTGFVAWSPFLALRSIPLEIPGLKPSEVAVGQALFMTLNVLGPLLGQIDNSLGHN